MATPDLSVFDRIRTKADYDREEEMFQLKRAAMQQAKAGNLPAALQIADRLTQLRQRQDPDAQQEIQDVMMAQKMLRVDPGVYMDQGVAGEIPGYSGVVGGIEGAKAGAKQEAQNISDYGWKPRIASDVRTAEDDATRAGKRKDEFDVNAKTLPVIDELRSLNDQSPDAPYLGVQQPIRRIWPGTSPEEASVEQMKQARIDLAAPLAKQLGVNPTDRDFLASLDRIFDMNASKQSRTAQIEALENRILRRQEQINAAPAQPPNLDPRNIPMDAVRELRADPSGAAEFDEIFGEGAARMVLGGQ